MPTNKKITQKDKRKTESVAKTRSSFIKKATKKPAPKKAVAKTRSSYIKKATKKAPTKKVPVKKAAPKPKLSSFGAAFKAARGAGKKEFTWKGKRYHTRTKEEEAARKRKKK